MNLLVDTHALLWFVSGDDQLSSTARKVIESPDTVNYISVASWWEMAVKCSLGKLHLDDPFDVFLKYRTREGFRTLSIETNHLPALVSLPFHHRDPFDRLIICQAIQEKMPVCSADDNFSRYEVEVIW
jgi:PIN domain nuclease of toxin-antitoxin system